MGRNQRAKKKKRSEKAKVQIKIKTKFLPKGQNVTDTAFKIKPIIVPKQLEEKNFENATGNLLSKRKFSIPELLVKLKHYNDTFKCDACVQLEEIVRNHRHDEYQAYLSIIVQNGSLLVQNKDRKVRKACVKLLETVLKSVPGTVLGPFFTNIVANLRCAMTNIDKNIQEDSLLVLDAMLMGDRTLLTRHFDRFFPDFLTLISKLRNESTNERTLTLNLGSKLTNVKWRIKVLSRLEAILQILLQNDTNTACPKNNKTTGNSAIYAHPVYKQYGQETMATTSDSSGPNNWEMGKQLTTLIPLLYESWLEVMPERTVKHDDNVTVLSDEAGAVLNCVIRIVYLLHNYTKNAETMALVFDTEDSAKFLQSLLVFFPYAKKRNSNRDQLSKDLSKVLTINEDPKCVRENLFICYYAFVIRPKQMKGSTEPALAFVQKCMSPTCRYYLTNDNSAIFAQILTRIVKTTRGKQLYPHLLEFYASENTPKMLRAQLLTLLISGHYKSDQYNEWLSKLTNSLHGNHAETSTHVLTALVQLTVEGNVTVREQIHNNFDNILNKHSQLDDPAIIAQLASLFYYGDCFHMFAREIQLFIDQFPHTNLAKCLRNVHNSMEYVC